MKDIARLILTLGLICTVAAVALSQVYSLTKGPIEHQKRMELLGAIQRVLPTYDNQPDQELVTIDERSFYPAFKDGQFVGAAIPVATQEGYSGEIKALVGVNAADEVSGVEVLDQRETPGLGSAIAKPEFLETMIWSDQGKKTRRTLKNTDWRVKKDGGDIDQITGATISPRALAGAIKEGLVSYKDNRKKIVAVPEQEIPEQPEEADLPKATPPLDEIKIQEQ